MALHRLSSLGGPCGQSLPYAARARFQGIRCPNGADDISLAALLRSSSFLIVPTDINQSSAHMAWQPNINASQAIDPARLKLSNRISRHLIQQSLEYQELVVGTDRLGNLRIEGPFIQAVVNSLDSLVHVVRVFLGDVNILPSSGIGEVAADKVIEFVG